MMLGKTLRVEVSRCWKVTIDGSMLLRDEDYINNEYYAYNRLLFKLLGLWQYRTSPKELMYVCFIILMITLGIFQHIYTLFMAKREIRTIIKLLEMTLPTLCFGFCYYNLLSNGVIMNKILHRVKCDWNDLANKPELTILKKYAHLSRLCTVLITFWFNLYVAFLIFPSLLRIFQYIFGGINKDELILPLYIEYIAKNEINYCLGISIQYTIIVLVATVGVANCSMFIAVIQHACALFNVVVWRANERFKRNRHNLYHVKNNTELIDENEWLVGIIKFYNKAIEFVDLIKLFYETIHLFGGSLVLIFIMIDYFYVFQILSFQLTKTEELTNISYIFASLMIIYAYFYLGQKLIDHNTNVFIGLCQIPFYSLSSKSQKMLLLLIMESMKPCNLSWEGAVVVSHELFVSFMRMSFSMAMVFYKLQ